MKSTNLENWLRASAELGFTFVAPFRFGSANNQHSCFAHVPEFGTANGMIVLLEFDAETVRAAQLNSYGYSCLSESEEPYNAQDFVDILNDWGWACRSKTAPAWYTGAPWSS